MNQYHQRHERLSQHTLRSAQDNKFKYQSLHYLHNKATINKKRKRSEWKICVKPPIPIQYELLSIGHGKFVTATKDTHSGKFLLYAYDTRNSEWNILFSWIADTENEEINSIAIDHEKSIIYVLSVDITGKLYQFEYQHGECRLIKATKINQYFHKRHKCVSICAQGQYHLIAKQCNKEDATYDNPDNDNNTFLSKSYHFIWDNERDSLKKVAKFRNNYSECGLINIASKNLLLLVGGTYGGSILCHSIKEQTWKHWKIRNLMATKLIASRSFGYILSPNEKYGVFCGGEQDITSMKSDHIYILNIDKRKIRQFNVKCPHKDTFRAFIASNVVRNSLIISGFFRQSMNTLFDYESLSNHPILPIAMMQIISNYHHQSDTLHLFSTSCNEHFKIDVRNL